MVRLLQFPIRAHADTLISNSLLIHPNPASALHAEGESLVVRSLEVYC